VEHSSPSTNITTHQKKLEKFWESQQWYIVTTIHKSTTFCFHLEGNVGVQQEAKATVDFEKGSNKDEKVSSIDEQPQSPTDQSQTKTSKDTRSVYKKNIANKSSLFFFY